MARLTIIIPALGPTEPFEATLASVLANRPEDADVVVTHAGSYGDPYDLAGEVNFVELPPGSGLVECLNLALLACDSDFVHLLAPGVEVMLVPNNQPFLLPLPSIGPQAPGTTVDVNPQPTTQAPEPTPLPSPTPTATP